MRTSATSLLSVSSSVHRLSSNRDKIYLLVFVEVRLCLASNSTLVFSKRSSGFTGSQSLSGSLLFHIFEANDNEVVYLEAISLLKVFCMALFFSSPTSSSTAYVDFLYLRKPERRC